MIVKNAQVGSEVFLQNDFLSLGINAYGGLGSTKYAPDGIQVNTANQTRSVGLFADLDGFGQGKETTLRDGVLRGVAVEGFNIGYKTDGKTVVHSNQMLDGLMEIDGKQTTRANAKAAEANWQGSTTEKLAVDQTLTLVEGAKYVRVEVKLTNNSGSAMTDLRYMRTVDPDHGPTMATENKIVQQGAGAGLVTASVKGGTPYFFYANDPRAVVSTYGFINEDPYAAAAYGTPQRVGYSVTADQSINITFGVGTLPPGKSTVVTFYMGITDDLTKTVAQINGSAVVEVPDVPVVVLVPHATDDLVTGMSGSTVKGNVLANDTDPAGRDLAATLKSGPANGTLKLNAEGSFTYTANKGFVGTDSFTYAATVDGKSDVATVKIVTTAAPPAAPGLPDSATLQRAGTLNGSASTSDVLTGTKLENSFFFDIEAASGNDQIIGFGSNDVFVTKGALKDSNGDGLIQFAKGTVTLDVQKDSVAIEGVKALRLIGTDDAGLTVYADASVRPVGAVEGRLGDDRMSGDSPDRKVNKFFADTALGLDLGHDTIANFGTRDILVTTTSLANVKVGNTVSLADGVIKLGGSGSLDLGSLDISGTGGSAIAALEFDGSVTRGDTTYFVYSHVGSAAGLDTLGM
ncbi:Ig-like domain-containing protein [Sphingomonas solaris]|uniref:Tandem-95 repeat protein n=1 Tax=Alterirhizorhabdus solaris TaxID=2529389 RepID=A0A558QRY4_9SPHN|nr:Ig-like domain-containing protein [Sphingomonas solaris]TVV69879.1 hypothetical protein FOY91_20545 [Sphingomonas solaris]